MKKVLISVLIAVMLLMSLSLSVYATSEATINPRYNNTLSAKVTMTISTEGLCAIRVSYVGDSSAFQSARIITKVQKNESGTWIDVDLDQPDDQWIDTSTLPIFSQNHSVQLTSRGTYRAFVVFEISGTGGATDVIERTIEKTY